MAAPELNVKYTRHAQDQYSFVMPWLAHCGLLPTPIGVAKRETPDPELTLAILKANHFPLLWIKPTGLPAYDWLLGTETFMQAYRVQRSQLEALRSEAMQVRDALARRGIAIAFIKAVDLAPAFPYYTGNQDILVRSQQVAQARSVLEQLGYLEVTHARERGKFLYRAFPGGRVGLSVHLHGHIGWDGNTYLEADDLWRRMVPSRTDPDLSIPSPEDALLITVAHAVDEDKQVRLADLAKVWSCLETGCLDWQYIAYAASARGWLRQLQAALCAFNHVSHVFLHVDLLPEPALALFRARRGVQGSLAHPRPVAADSPGLPFPLRFTSCKLLSYEKILRDPLLSPRQRLQLLVECLLRGTARKLRLRTQPSMLISLSGIDGAGKTVNARCLREAFAACEVNATYVWMRGSTSQWLAPLRRLAGVLLGRRYPSLRPPPRGQCANTERIRAIDSRWVRAAYRWVMALELLLFYSRQVTVPLLLGKVVICDRYIYDHMADWVDRLGNARAYDSLPARLLRLVVPRPDEAFLLDVPAEIVLARRQDEKLPQSIENRIAALRYLSERYGLRRLDASRPPDQVAQQLIDSVLVHYLHSYWAPVNAVFRYNSAPGPDLLP